MFTFLTKIKSLYSVAVVDGHDIVMVIIAAALECGLYQGRPVCQLPSVTPALPAPRALPHAAYGRGRWGLAKQRLRCNKQELHKQ